VEERNQSTVLVVDDELGTRLSLRFLLSPRLRVIEAESGAEALGMLGENAVDLVVSDVRMPGMTGVALLEAIRDLYPALPVILITAYGSPGMEREAMSSGAAAFLSKPFENHEMLDLVTQNIC